MSYLRFQNSENVLRHQDSIDGINYVRFVGTAEDLSTMVKGWIVDDLDRIPYENRRSFYDDGEFLNALEIADTLDGIWLDGFEGLYQLSYIDGEGFINGTILKLVGKEID